MTTYDPERKPIFIFSAGCEKGGTTWLASYLDSHPQVAPPLTKELHVLEYHFDPRVKAAKQHSRHKRLRQMWWNPFLNFGLGQRAAVTRAEIALRLKLSDSLESYRDYFLGLVDADCPATYDFTPKYSCLGAEEFRAARQVMREAGFDVKVIFLMRDPVERIWSMVRMQYASGRSATLRSFLRRRIYRSAKAGLDRHIVDPNFECLTRYDNTLAVLESAFEPEEIWTGFYETLFDQAVIDNITRFLGLAPYPAETDRRVHESAKATGMTSADRALIRQHYAPVYEDIAHRFGEEKIRTIWPSYAETATADQMMFR